MHTPHFNANRPDGNRGFTVIEVMVVMVLLAILTTIAFPAYRSFVVGQRVKNTSFDIMAMLTLTRSEAIKRNAAVRATPTNGDWAQGWSVTTTSTGTVLNHQDALPAGNVTITCYQGTPPITPAACAFIEYNASGRITNSQQQAIQIKGQGISATDGTGGGARCIRVDLSGRPNSEKGTCV